MQNQSSAERAPQLPFHLTINELSEQIFRWSRSKMYELLADADHGFPGPVLIAGRNRLWSRDEVLAWVANNRPAHPNPRRAVVVERTRGRAIGSACGQHDGHAAVRAGLLAGFTPVSKSRAAA